MLKEFQLNDNELGMFERNQSAKKAIKRQEQVAFADLYARLRSNSSLLVRLVSGRLDLETDWLVKYEIKDNGQCHKIDETSNGPNEIQLNSEELQYFEEGKRLAKAIREQGQQLFRESRRQLNAWVGQLRLVVAKRLKLSSHWLDLYSIDPNGVCTLKG